MKRILLLDVTEPEHVQRQCLEAAIGQAVLRCFGLEPDDVMEDHAIHGAEIGRWIVVPWELIAQVVGDVGNSFSNAQFDHAYESIKSITHASEDTALNALMEFLSDHFGHDFARAKPTTSFAPIAS